MNYSLKSKALNVIVSDTGAELQSIFSNITGRELLWQGNPAVWGGRAPVLFPFIGASEGGTYVYNGQTHTAPRHGFVRTAYFHKASDFSENRISLEYTDNAFTRKFYPFTFTFTVTFSLEGRDGEILCVENFAQNHGDGVMPFLMGAHEAYNCSPFEDYYLEFDRSNPSAPMESETVNLNNGLLTGEKYPVPLSGNTLPLDYSLFDKDTLVFTDVNFKKAMLKSKRSTGMIEVEFDAPNLAIWTRPGGEYVCVEPWYGLPGTESAGKGIADRFGAVSLMPGKVFGSRHRIRVIS